ncbi:MAG TPA: GAF domain-containing sensor histidine kinase [Candidatus Sulfomarinibacteraceae bacterium]|nr:GAF domain-containing sensor histidine kinase [Candidatus Sulfomarinibacteraceae bacterium]
MTATYLFYGLAFFTLGLAALLESRRSSGLLLGRQLPWLAAFGFVHSIVEWSELLLLTTTQEPLRTVLSAGHFVLLPLSAMLLIRFGVGLISEAGPLPGWLLLSPSVLLVPMMLIGAYALVVTITEPGLEIAGDIWSRYLLFFPGALLATAGFLRQARELDSSYSPRVRSMMTGAGIAFFLYAFFAGLIVPEASYGLAPWLNYEAVQQATGAPVQVWRMLSALGVTVFVVRALDVFDFERKRYLEAATRRQEQAESALRRERERAREAQLEVETEARRVAERWVNTLVEIGQLIAHMENADVVLLHIMERAQQLLDTDTAALGLLDESGERLEIRYQAAGGSARAVEGHHVLDNPALVRMLRTGRSYRFPDDLEMDQISWHCPTVAREIKTAAVAPLQFDGQVVGGIWAARFQPRSFTSTQLFGLQNLADQAVIALQHASMAAQLQSVATLEERSRIAREMHDGLAQILGYLGIQMQTIEAYMKRGQEQQVLDEIRKTRENVRLAQDDVRDNILSLRTTLSGDAGLIPALQEYVAEFGVQSGADTSLVNYFNSPPRLSPLAEVQLVRIVQEALTNVRKHARAAHVEVQLSPQDGGLSILVRDDGVGFEPGEANGRFGLQTMEERAGSVGGRLAVQSEPQGGTEVSLWLPLLRE